MLFRVLRTFLAPYKSWLATIVVLQFLSTGAMLYLPSLNADIIDKGVAQGDQDYIVRTGAWMLAVSVLQIICSVTASYCASRASMGFGRDLRRALFSKVGSFGAFEIGRFGAPSLITRTTNDAQQVQMFGYLVCGMAASIPIMMIGAVFMALHQDAHLAWLFAVLIPALFVTVGIIASRIVPNMAKVQSRLDGVNRVLREQITGIRVVRAFVREPQEKVRFDVANEELTDVSLKAGRWLALFFPMMMVIVNVAAVGVIWFGGHLVDDGTMQVGPLTAFLSYLMQVMMSVMMGTFVFMQMPRSAVCAERIQEVLDVVPSIVMSPTGVASAPAGARGELTFADVDFTYPGAEQPVLTDLSFTATRGQTVAVIGSTGAGKSTLINLVPRLFDTTDGAVRVDGIDVREWAPDALGARLGLVPQRAFLFSGTIRSNLLYGANTAEDATDEALWHALEIAQAADFVRAMESGLDSPVVQGGTNFSGGQRQRLAIARALVRRPEIYLFDDSFSALDLATDARLRAALKPETRDSTVVIVAQRVSTIRDADLILVLDDGRIVGRGTHEELVASNPTYQEIVASQLSAEEAAA
ncbi:ABC transporter ATP-binding protein [Nocardioides sp. Kera G14]|uniref:ABC transporter ATP-binding protein n=1 Tax=Nocardioides sp. Kera G14 TaxID=2884264 RepID=UPI001D12CAF6|nr:ABC transporter ATP-binding protein [Nocardioides sp. Kera G14]UDY23989.1 ABC transporter ATP-binding protein/permease [Nocardioides sp. Kera G14]